MANNILTFCGTDTGTNLLTQSEYNLSTDRTSGNKPGIASAKLANRALRQSAFIASQIAQFLTDKTGQDILDNDNTADLLATINLAFGTLTIPAVKTTTYAVLANDQVLLGTTAGGAFTMTLPTAVGRTGKVYTFKKTNSGLAGLTIATTSAQTIDAATTRVLYTLNEVLQVISNGANWEILEHQCDTPWSSTYAITPTNFGTVSANSLKTRREGDSLRIRGGFTGGTMVASPGYLALLTGLAVDPAKTDINVILGSLFRLSTVGATALFGTSFGMGLMYNGSDVDRIYITNESASNALTTYNANNFTANSTFSVDTTVAIDGWFS